MLMMVANHHSKPKGNQNIPRHQEMNKSDQEESEILEAFESGKL